MEIYENKLGPDGKESLVFTLNLSTFKNSK